MRLQVALVVQVLQEMQEGSVVGLQRRPKMRKHLLSSALALGIFLPAAIGAWAATVQFDPPAQAGTIFAVVNYDRANGQIRPTSVSVDWGSFHRKRIIVPPYKRCENVSPAGFVVKIRPRTGQSRDPLILSTNGSVARGLYQGEMPLEVLHPCYKLVLM
jgi:hypothetical protein